MAQTRWQRSGGHGFFTDKPFTPEDVIANWKKITSFGECMRFVTLSRLGSEFIADDGRSTHPASTQEAASQVRSRAYRCLFSK